MSSVFYDTKSFFTDAVGYKKPFTYEEWLNVTDEYKSAALFVQFYNQIYLAWNKSKSLQNNDECEGVEIVLQYLEKNVPIIKKDKQRFTPNYIYKVAYNCLTCICRNRKCDKERFDNEIYDTVNNTERDEELSLFDTTHTNNANITETDYTKAEFWKSIKELRDTVYKNVSDIFDTVIEDLINKTDSVKSNVTDDCYYCKEEYYDGRGVRRRKIKELDSEFARELNPRFYKNNSEMRKYNAAYQIIKTDMIERLKETIEEFSDCRF